MKEKEFDALRQEILQWQGKRFIVFNGTTILLIAYLGWMIKNENGFNLGWEVVSIFPIILIAIAAQMNRIFEMYVMKIGSFIQVFLDSKWETLNDKFSVEDSFLKIGLNRAYSILYLIIGIASTVAFYAKYEFYSFWTLALFIFFSVIAFVTLMLLSFWTDNYRVKMVNEWEIVKCNQSQIITTSESSTKTKNTMDKKENKKEKDNYLRFFIIIAIVFLTLSIVFPFIINAIFSDWSESGTFGDTFGALNAFFSGLALAGVIVTILIQRTELKNQRNELSLQRDEMKETREEFLLNRSTTLIYNQLDKFEKALSEFTIRTLDKTTLIGNDAILYLKDNENIVAKPLDKPEEEYNEEMKEAIIKLLKIYTPNKSNLDKFAHDAYNSVEVLKRIIFKTNLDIDDLNDLKNLFFVNIGFINMSVLNRISEITELQFKYLDAEDYISNDLDIGKTVHANIFLKSINKFHQLRLNRENFEENKAKWIESVGSLEK